MSSRVSWNVHVLTTSVLQRATVSAVIISQLALPNASLAQATKAKASASPAAPAASASPAAPAASQGVLMIEDYLAQVKTGNQAFAASHQGAEGADQRAGEYKLLTRPTLIGNVNATRSQAEAFNQGNDNKITTYSLGVNETTNFGLQATLNYIINDVSSNAVIPPGLPGTPNAVTAGPVLTLTGSLWRNFFGEEIRAAQAQLQAAALSSKYSLSFQQTQLLADAETAYWRLALAREQVVAAKEVLALTQRSQKWSSNRQRLALTDRSDLLQANAAMLARQLDLQVAVDNEKTAARYFNTVRGNGADVVDENLNSFEANMIDRLSVPGRVEFRDDVKAAEQQQRFAQANSRLGVQRNTPTINVVGTIGLNGRDPSFGEATSKSFGSNNPNYAIGVALMVPIDQWTASDVRAGYRKEVQAADALLKRRIFEQERLWHDLTILFQDALGRFKIANELEKAQREKIGYERDRHSRGRSTLYQVILFEGEYAGSQLARIRSQAEVLNAYAQLKTFGSNL